MLTSMNIGGVEKSFLSLLSTIPKEKYDITLLLLERKGGFLEYIPPGIKVEETTWFSRVKQIIMQPPQQTVRNLMYNKKILKIVNFINVYFISKFFNNRYLYYKNVLKDVPNNPVEYDIAISYQGPTDIIDYYIAKKVNAKRKISWVHFDVSKHRINEKLYKKLYQNYEKIFVVSNQGKDKLIEKVPTITNKTEVFMNIIPKDVIIEMSKMPIEFDNNYKGLRIVTVGRLSKEKGQDLAIKVLSRLRSEGYEVRWYCIGEGNDRGEYERLIQIYGLKEDFLLIGASPNPYPYIQQSDIYVQTSRHEGYCLTLAEAKCLLKPIVTTNFIGAFEQIQDGYNGFIAHCSEEEIYKKIQYLIENKNMRQRLRINLIKESFIQSEQLQRFF
ncbi:glycosyltransferase [Bacillus sp. FJAT-50079]|nr:glycosyltransferase [Bacillus sp. FJAT-50079]